MAYQLNKTYLLFSNSGSGKCLNVSGGTVANNRNVCILDKNDSAAQNWMVKAFGSNLKLVTGLNQSYALNYYWSAGQGKPGNCDIYPQSGNDADSCIVLEPVSTDVYRIKLKNYNLYLTATGTGNNADVRWEALVPLGSDYSLLAPQEWRFLDPSEKGFRAPFIYAGYHKSGTKYSYTDQQLSGLGNATEFVITSTYQGYFTKVGEPATIGGTTYIQHYVMEAAEMAKRLYNMYGKQIWIGTPAVGNTVPYEKPVFEEIGRRMTYFINNIITQFGLIGLDFNTVVKGIYITDEQVLSTFDTNTSIADNYQINMFQTVSTYAASKGKKMLWSPYWSTDNLNRAACVIHRTNIFDYMVIQPGYYYENPYLTVDVCKSIRKGIAIQRLCYGNGWPILHESAITCTKTVIGCQMEIDNNYTATNAYGKRYQECVDIFSASEGAYSKATTNFGFYFDCPWEENDASYNIIKAKVNEFFK